MDANTREWEKGSGLRSGSGREIFGSVFMCFVLRFMGVVGRRCLCEDTLPVQGIDTGSVYGPSAVVKWKKRRVDAVDGIDLVDGGCGARGEHATQRTQPSFLNREMKTAARMR